MSDQRERLILCFDGTWNALKSHTNVSRLYAEIADASGGGARQRKYYDEGVGTGRFDKLRGGLFGYGLDRNIRTGYAWLASQFAPDGAPVPGLPHPTAGAFVGGPDIYLFGFSRGAFTARSLGGLVNYLGIPKIDRSGRGADVSLSDHETIRQAWDLYVNCPDADAREKAGANDARVRAHDAAVAAFRAQSHYPVRLHFVGVWDTVGALGIPNIWDSLDLRFSSKYKFHDTALGASVRNAYHAVAIDEHRLPYTPALWTSSTALNENVEQRWFPGAHSNVGGGYDDDLLPAPPLRWLAARAAHCGLAFIANGGKVPAAFDLDGREHLSPVRDSYAEFMGGAYRAARSLPGAGGRVYRRMLVPGDGINQTVDETAFAKWRADPDYRPPNLGQAGRTDVTFRPATGGSGHVVSAGKL